MSSLWNCLHFKKEYSVRGMSSLSPPSDGSQDDPTKEESFHIIFNFFFVQTSPNLIL